MRMSSILVWNLENDFFPVSVNLLSPHSIFRYDCDSGRLQRSTSECDEITLVTPSKVNLMKKNRRYVFTPCEKGKKRFYLI